MKTLTFAHIAHDLDITGYLDARDILYAIYKASKQQLPETSWLSLSEFAGTGRTNVLHLIVQGKRPLSCKSSKKMADAFEWKGRQRQYWLILVAWQNERDASKREVLFRKLYTLRERSAGADLDPAMFEFFETWYYPAVRELVALKDFRSDPEWIAHTLIPNIRVDEARKSLELLERLNMIRYDHKQGRHVLVHDRVSTGSEVDSMSVVRYHQNMLDHAKDSITGISETLRDISAITLNADPQFVKQVKVELEAFRLRLLGLSEQNPNGSQVWQLNLQFFPLSSVVEPLKAKRRGDA